MTRLLEEKITQLGSDSYSPPQGVLPLSRILIRNKSPIISDHLANGVKKFARKLNFEELHSAMYALRSSYQVSGNATKLKQLELDVIANIRDGGAKSRNARVLAERIFFLDNSFRGNSDSMELQKELLI